MFLSEKQLREILRLSVGAHLSTAMKTISLTPATILSFHLPQMQTHIQNVCHPLGKLQIFVFSELQGHYMTTPQLSVGIDPMNFLGLFQKQRHLFSPQTCVLPCVCEASASDVSLIVSTYGGLRPQPRGVPAAESSRPRQGEWVLPHRAKWLSSSWARGHQGSLPPIATVCTPTALPSEGR